jgi:hypothetical protein
MGGKGAQPQNNQMVAFEMEQAAKADRKEAERQARLDKGMKSISETFHGKEIMKDQPAKIDAKSLTGLTGDLTGQIVSGPGSVGTGQTGQIGDTGWTYRVSALPAGHMSGMAGYNMYEALDPQGTVHAARFTLPELVQDIAGMDYMKPTGTGQFEADPFAPIKDKYKSSLTDLHKANISKTYNKALDETIFATARAGQRGSTTARDALADIGGANYVAQPDGTFKEVDYGQYGDAKTKMVGDIDKSLGDLNTQIQSAEDSAENQLYMTEDPEKAANAAKQLAANIPAVPQYNSLGDLFKPLVIGATGFYSGYQGQNSLNNAGFPTSKSPFGSGSAKESSS